MKSGAIRQNTKNNTFKLEIFFVLVVKVALIISLKLLFFNEPIDQHLTHQDIDQLVLGQSVPVAGFSSDKKNQIHDYRRDR